MATHPIPTTDRTAHVAGNSPWRFQRCARNAPSPHPQRHDFRWMCVYPRLRAAETMNQRKSEATISVTPTW